MCVMPDICPIYFPASADPSSSGGKVTMVRNLKLLLWKNFILKVGKAGCEAVGMCGEGADTECDVTLAPNNC